MAHAASPPPVIRAHWIVQLTSRRRIIRRPRCLTMTCRPVLLDERNWRQACMPGWKTGVEMTPACGGWRNVILPSRRCCPHPPCWRNWRRRDWTLWIGLQTAGVNAQGQFAASASLLAVRSSPQPAGDLLPDIAPAIAVLVKAARSLEAASRQDAAGHQSP